MNLAIAIAVFPVIFLGEVPDKTMMASLLLATRGRARSVWLGAAAAFVVHVAIATTVGVTAARLLPPRVTEAAVAVMFALGALIVLREIWHEHRRTDGPIDTPPPPARPHATMVTAFIVIFTAEWGDLTQILTANLAAEYHAPLSVGAGALLALWSVSAIAVRGGQRLAKVIRPTLIRLTTVTVLTGLAAYSAWMAFA